MDPALHQPTCEELGDIRGGPQKARRDVTLWFDEGAIDAWNAPATGHPGGQRHYSDLKLSHATTRLTSDFTDLGMWFSM